MDNLTETYRDGVCSVDSCNEKSSYKQKLPLATDYRLCCIKHGLCSYKTKSNMSCNNSGTHQFERVNKDGETYFDYRCVRHRFCQTPSCDKIIANNNKCSQCLKAAFVCKYVGCKAVLDDGGYCEFHQGTPALNKCTYGGSYFDGGAYCYCKACGRKESYCIFHRKLKAHGDPILSGITDDGQYVGDDVDFQKWFNLLKEEQLCTCLMTYDNGDKRLCCWPNFLPVTDKCWIHMPEDKLQEAYDHVFGEGISCVCSVDGCTQVALNRDPRLCCRHAQERSDHLDYKRELSDLFDKKIPGAKSRIIK